MAKAKKSLSSNILLTALLYILVGVMFIVFRGSLLKWGLTIIGALAIIYGIFLIANKQVVAGIIYMLVGIAVILGAWLYFGYVILVIGAVMIVRGIIDLIQASKKKSHAMAIVVAILTIIVGILLIVSKWVVLDWFFIIVGAVLIVDGILVLIGKRPIK